MKNIFRLTLFIFLFLFFSFLFYFPKASYAVTCSSTTNYPKFCSPLPPTDTSPPVTTVCTITDACTLSDCGTSCQFTGNWGDFCSGLQRYKLLPTYSSCFGGAERCTSTWTCSVACGSSVGTCTGGTCTAGTGSTNASCGGVAGYECQGVSTCEQLTYRCSSGSCVVGSHQGAAQSFCCPSGQSCLNGSCSSGAPPNCNSGISCGACSNSCGAGTQNCTYTTLSTGGACTQVPAPSQSCTGTSCGAVCGDGSCNGSETCSTCSTDCGACPPTPTPTPTPIPIPTYTVSGIVYQDSNRNGVQDCVNLLVTDYPTCTGSSSEPNYTAGAEVDLSTGASTTSNASGSYTFSNLTTGNYNVTLIPPPGYQATTTNPATTSVGPSITVNFGIAPLNSIAGNVFVDQNKNGIKDGADANYTGTASTVEIRTGSCGGALLGTLNTSTGVYTTNATLPGGSYFVCYTSLPAGYQITYPQNGPPPSFNVTVGSNCSVGESNSASCN